MEVIPAIDLLEGSCVRLHQGKYSEVTFFSDDPIAQALIWEEQGARMIHLVDLDGAKTGKPLNDQSIREITKAISIPIQIGGGIRSLERAEILLDYGVNRVIFGTSAIEQPELIKELASRHPQKIIVGIDAKEGKVATRGWIKESNILTKDLVKEFSNINLAAFICTDISTDGTLKGPNIQAIKEIAEITNIPVIASGGVGSLEDLIALSPLENYGVTGVIVGRALYDQKFTLEEAIISMTNSNIQDHTSKNKYLA